MTIKEKNIDLKLMDCFGENSILMEGGIRANTLFAKTKSKVISMSRENIRSSLGDNIKNTIKKNRISKLLEESDIFKENSAYSWKEAIETCVFTDFKKG